MKNTTDVCQHSFAQAPEHFLWQRSSGRPPSFAAFPGPSGAEELSLEPPSKVPISAVRLTLLRLQVGMRGLGVNQNMNVNPCILLNQFTPLKTPWECRR